MADVVKTKLVRAGGWRTLESGWNAIFSCIFRNPAGAQVKVRYGSGWWFGWDSQKKTLNGTDKIINVTRVSIAYARVQIRVLSDTEVRYTYVTPGPSSNDQ
ncbi:MAG: hypothetical protein ACR2F2_07750 [Pyrinomonadaceae bacterium]